MKLLAAHPHKEGVTFRVVSRALTKTESRRVRKRLQEIVSEKGTQVAAGRAIRLSQQAVSTTLASDTVGRHVAKRIAEYDCSDVEDLLAGKVPPKALRDTLRSEPGRWHDLTVAFVRAAAHAMRGAEGLGRDDWREMLDICEATIEPLARKVLRR